MGSSNARRLIARSLLPGLALLAAQCGDSKPSGGGPPPAAPARPATSAKRDAPPHPRTPAAAPRSQASPPRERARVEAPARPATPPPRPAFAPCAAAPKDMVCIPGGPFWRGSDHHGRNARPKAQVVVGTFYMDRHEITTPAYVACVKAGICKPPPQYLRYGGFHGPTQPAVPVSWPNALRICLMQGKRLPTEAEWEKAARTTDGRTYPWGEEAPTCRRAHRQGCKPARTLPVGSLPPNPYGLYDMAGNGYEWVMDWYSPCYGGCKGACDGACAGPDPRGPCEGVLRCKGHRQRVLRGGSWYWSATHGRTMWRRPEYPESGGHRLSVRCATRSATPQTRTPAEVNAILTRLDTTPLPL